MRWVVCNKNKFEGVQSDIGQKHLWSARLALRVKATLLQPINLQHSHFKLLIFLCPNDNALTAEATGINAFTKTCSLAATASLRNSANSPICDLLVAVLFADDSLQQ